MKSNMARRDKAFTTRSAILMARLVDGSGAAIRQADVLAVDYSIYELDLCGPNNFTVVAGCQEVELGVAVVLFDALQTDTLWTVDDTGYNFRHEIRPVRARAIPKAGVEYELRYQFVFSNRENVVLRFHIRCSRLDDRC